jgi:multiple sugar transport system substrate-binding protein
MISRQEEERKKTIAKAADLFSRRKISRRDFVKMCGAAGLGFSMNKLMNLGNPRSNIYNTPLKADPAAGEGPAPEVAAWLKDVGSKFKGKTIRIVSEATPPSRAIDELTKSEFMPLTGINVQWELLPLEQVLFKISVDAAGGLGANDVYYEDQAWVARFINDTVDPRDLWAKKPDLAFPNYNPDDFLKPLVDHIVSYKGKWGGLVCDIPIYIMMYRKDIFDELKLQVPTTMDEYMNVVKAINEAKAPNTYGTIGQWKSGHYSLECDWTEWLWTNGGSVFNSEGKSVVNDEKGLAGLEYMLQLGKYMPPGVTTWDWSGQAEAFAQGLGGIYICWGEFFPLYDTPEKSKIVGLAEAADPPKPVSLRKPEECAFEETPGNAHQGGSGYCLSRYSREPDATWVFLQWATSSDVQTRAAIMGGGASPVRQSTFDDPRTKAAAKVQAGTTRHFDVTERAIKGLMGTEPHLTSWSTIANNIFAVELGKLTTGGYKTAKECADVMAKLADQEVGIYA